MWTKDIINAIYTKIKSLAQKSRTQSLSPSPTGPVAELDVLQLDDIALESLSDVEDANFEPIALRTRSKTGMMRIPTAR